MAALWYRCGPGNRATGGHGGIGDEGIDAKKNITSIDARRHIFRTTPRIRQRLPTIDLRLFTCPDLSGTQKLRKNLRVGDRFPDCRSTLIRGVDNARQWSPCSLRSQREKKNGLGLEVLERLVRLDPRAVPSKMNGLNCMSFRYSSSHASEADFTAQALLGPRCRSNQEKACGSIRFYKACLDNSVLTPSHCVLSEHSWNADQEMPAHLIILRQKQRVCAPSLSLGVYSIPALH